MSERERERERERDRETEREREREGKTDRLWKNGTDMRHSIHYR